MLNSDAIDIKWMAVGVVIGVAMFGVISMVFGTGLDSEPAEPTPVVQLIDELYVNGRGCSIVRPATVTLVEGATQVANEVLLYVKCPSSLLQWLVEEQKQEGL